MKNMYKISSWAYLIYFELIGSPKPNKDNPTPLPYFSDAMDRTGVVSIILEYTGMMLDCPCLPLEAQLVQKSAK